MTLILLPAADVDHMNERIEVLKSAFVVPAAILTIFLFVRPEPINQLPEGGGLVFLKTLLVHVDKVVCNVCLCPVDVFAPLPQTLHLAWYVQIFLPLGFDDNNPFIPKLD